jgi:hypothetical protein
MHQSVMFGEQAILEQDRNAVAEDVISIVEARNSLLWRQMVESNRDVLPEPQVPAPLEAAPGCAVARALIRNIQHRLRKCFNGRRNIKPTLD